MIRGVRKAPPGLRHFRWLSLVIKDFEYAWRGLRRSSLFTLAVVGSLILGIGASLTVLTLMRAALWRPLPIDRPEQIVHLRRANPAGTAGESSFSYVLFQQLRASAGSKAQVIAKTSARQRKFGIDSDSRERVIGEAVSDDFFAVLGVVPSVGRLLVAGDDGLGSGQRIAVLSDRFWRTRFRADPAVVGRTIYYDEAPFTIVGVAMPGFDGVDAERPVQVWIPLTADVAITPQWLRESSFHWLTLFARLRSDVSVPTLQSMLDTRFRAHLATELLPDMSPRFRSMFEGEHLQLRAAAAGLATTGRRYEPQLRVLAGLAFCLLLICCANVANLVRARSAGRRNEFALRRALGASGSRIYRLLLAEGLLLSSFGILGSLLAASWIAEALLRLLPTDPPLAFDLKPDLMILTLAVLLGTASAIIAIAWPAWRQESTGAALRATANTTRRIVVSNATVALQLATALVLLVVAGLSLSMLRAANGVHLGFDGSDVVSVELSFPRGTPSARVSTALERMRQRLENSKEVESASYAFPSVYDHGGTSMTVVPIEYNPAPGQDTQAGIIDIGPGFFATLQIPLNQGRTFTAADVTTGAPVVIVNATFARRYFANGAALSRSVRIPGQPHPTVATIVGIVGDVRHYGVREKPWPMVYRPGALPGARLLVRLRAPTTATSVIPPSVGLVDATAQVEAIRPLEEVVAAMISRERLLAVLSSVVAMIAIALAALGLYGIVAYGVTSRRSEFGVRMALGAQGADIRRLVLHETSRIVLIGVAAGIAGGLLASEAVSRVVPDAPPTNWLLVSGAAFGLATITMLAAWIPARDAARTDLAETLRCE